MVRLTLPMLLAIVEALAAIGTARALRRIGRRSADSASASQLAGSISAQLLVGLPIHGTLLFLAAGLFSTSRLVVCGVTLPAALYAAATWRSERRPTHPEPRVRDALGALAITVAGVIAFLFAQLPAFSLDELAYHLAVPMQWIVEGRVSVFPLNSHSWFPFGLESADLFALRLLGHDGAVASHFVRVFCGIALVRLLAQRLARESPRPLWLAAAIVTTPALLVTVGWSWNEVALTGIVVVLFLALEDAVRSGDDLTWIGLAMSAGLLTKYTFAPIALLLVGAGLLACEPTQRRRLARAAAIGGVAGSIFFARNALLTGNPFEPLLTQGTGDVGFRWTGSALTTAASYVFDPRIIDEALGISLLLLAPLSLPRADSPFARRSCVALLVACGASALLTPSARVFLPFLIVPALVGGLTISRLGVPARRAIAIVLGIAIPAQLAVVAYLLDADDPLTLLLDRASVPEWLSTHRPITSDVLWIDAALPPRSRTLVLGIHELFWFSHEVRGAGNNDGSLVSTYLRAGDPERLRDRLKSDGFTHLANGRGLVLDRSADFKGRERATLLDAEVTSTLTEFLLTQRLVAIREPTMLFELR